MNTILFKKQRTTSFLTNIMTASFLRMAYGSVFAFLLLMSSGVFGQTATYTVSTTSSVTTGGTAPSGSSATYSQTYSTAGQMTSGNSATLTLSGYAGYTISSIILQMKSNVSSGGGTLDVKAGATTIVSISPAKNFNDALWNGTYSSSFVDITKTPSAHTISSGNNIVITIGATANSLYIQKYTIVYASAAVCTDTPSPGNTIASSTSVVSGGTTSLSLQIATTGSGVTYQWEQSSDNATYTTIVGATSATHTTAAINAKTYYRCKVTCGANTETSTPLEVVLKYCTPAASGIQTYIENFSTTGGSSSNITNTASGFTTGGYQDNYSTMVVNGFQDTSFNYSFTLVGGTAGVAIWVDWNRNYLFETSERVYNSAGFLASAIYSGSISIPLGTPIGDYRMRIVTNYLSSNPDPCTSTSRLEAEDYKVAVLAASITPLLAITGTTDNGATCSTVAAATKPYTITNTGTNTASNVTIVSNDAQFVLSGLSSTTIPGSGGTVTYNVTFTPSSAGAKAATITVASTTSGSNSPTSALTGTGTAVALGAVATSAVGTITAKSAVLNGSVSSVGTCPPISQRGFVYSVTATNGTPTNAGTGVTTIPVAGITTGSIATTPATLLASTQYSYRAYVLNGATYTYGNVINFTTSPALVVSGTLAHGSSCPTFATPSQTNTITNNSASTVTGISVGSNNPEFVVSGLSGTSIAAGATATYTVTFTPASSGAKTATITVTSSGASVTSTLSGTGITPVTPAAVTAAASNIATTTVTLNATSGTTFSVCANTTEKGFVIAPTVSSPTPIVGGTGVTKEVVTSLGTSGVAYSKGLTALTASTGYSYRAYLYNGSTYTYGNVNTFVTLVPLINDKCSGAIILTPSGTCTPTTGSTVNATDNDETGDCTAGTEKAVWYKFSATSIAHTIIVAGSLDFDPVVGVLSSCGSATSPTGGECTDLTLSGATETLELSGLTIGSTYYIQVYDYYGAEKPNGFTICVTTPIDPCDNILAITACGTNINATIASGEGMYNTESCYSTPGKELIYSYTPIITGSYKIQQTDSSGSYTDYLYKAAGTCNSSGWLCIGYLYGNELSTAFILSAGTTYYIMLDAEDTLGKSISFNIVCEPDNPCVPSNENSNSVFINKITFLGTQNDIIKTSTFSVGGYQNFTSLPTNPSQIQGEGINIKVNTNSLAFIRAWIDLNGDGDFVDSQEQIFTTQIGQLGTTFGYQVPLTLPPGNYKIRIRVENYNNGSGNVNFGSCDDLTTAGETEDYLLTVLKRCGAQIATVTDQEICGSGTAALQASTVSSGVTEFRWYTAPSGGSYFTSAIASNTTTFTTPLLTQTTSFYVVAFDGTCETQVRKEVKAIVNEIPEVSFSPATPVSCGENEPIELTAEDALETVYLLNENFDNGTLATSAFSNVNIVNNVAVNSISKWDVKTSTFIPTLSELSWIPAISSGFGANNFAFATADVGPKAPSGYYTIDNALQMKTAINTNDFQTLTISFRIYFSRYSTDGVTPNKEYVSVEVSEAGAAYTPLSSPIKYTASQGNPGKFALKTVDISNYINKPNIKFRLRYHSELWADGVAIDDVQIYGSKTLTASYSWSGSDITVFTDAALQNAYVTGTPTDKVYVVPGLALLQNSSFDIEISTTLTNGCVLNQNIPVTNNSKIWAGTNTNWNTPTNWKPTGVPTDLNCIIIPSTVIQPLISSGMNVVGNTVSVKNNAELNIPSGSTLTVTNEVMVENGGTLEIFDGGSVVQVTNVENSSANNNRGSLKMHRITKPLFRYDYTYWSSPIFGDQLPAIDTNMGEFSLHDLSPTTLADKYYKWNPASGWQLIWGGNEAMIPGKGYIIRAPQTYNIAGTGPAALYNALLTGRTNNGIVRTQIATGATSWNLLGNPYPSAIDAQLLLDQNPNLGGTLYFWTHNTTVSAAQLQYNPNDYASWNSSGGTSTTAAAASSVFPDSGINAAVPSGYIAAGQAFFVSGTAVGGSEVVFNNTIRVGTQNNQFFRPVPTQPADNWATTGKHRVWLNLKGQEKGFNQILVGYIENATNNYDDRYDGETFGGNFVTFYSLLNSKSLVIQGRALPFVNSDTVPLGYNTTLTGNLTISIDQVDGLLNGQDIYLQDNVLNVTHDLKVSDYTFATTPGTFNTRFVLRYMPQETLDNPTFNEQIKGVVIRMNEAVLHVSSPFETINTVSVYDITGRLVFEKKDCNTNTFDASHIVYADQTLIVKVKLNNGAVVTQKVF